VAALLMEPGGILNTTTFWQTLKGRQSSVAEIWPAILL
jgi:hypothetical protein